MFSEQTKIGINGSIEIPGDKSISHRSIICDPFKNLWSSLTHDFDDFYRHKNDFILKSL